MPWVWAPSTSSGYGAGRSGSSALSLASRPTCGPFPWVITRSWSPASGASASTATPTCFSWISASGTSPRSSRALPPTATTRRISATEAGDHYRLDGVEPVLRLVEDDGGGRLEDLVGDLQGGEVRLVEDLATELGLGVVQGREAVHELYVGGSRRLQGVGIDLVGEELTDPRVPV